MDYWSLVIGHWSLVIGRWSLVVGRWSLVMGHGSLVMGRWSLVMGHGSLVVGHYPICKLWDEIVLNLIFLKKSVWCASVRLPGAKSGRSAGLR
jgi:hypothetical protein